MARQFNPLTISAGSSRIVSLDLTPQLDSGEVLTAVTIDDPDGLTISNAAVSTSQLTILGRTVAIGKAVQFLLEGPTVGSYNVVLSLTTDSTPNQTQKWDQPITIE